MFWTLPGAAGSTKIVVLVAPPDATALSDVASNSYPGPHQTIHFLYDSQFLRMNIQYIIIILYILYYFFLILRIKNHRRIYTLRGSEASAEEPLDRQK